MCGLEKLGNVDQTGWNVVIRYRSVDCDRKKRFMLLIPLLLFTNKERSSSKRRMEGGIADETSMPPFKCECFGLTA